MLGTALVAATVGVQLAAGSLGLEAGLCVLILAPELYAPLRELGAQFHAGADGLAAAERILELLDAPAAVAVHGPAARRPGPGTGAGLARRRALRLPRPRRAGARRRHARARARPGHGARRARAAPARRRCARLRHAARRPAGGRRRLRRRRPARRRSAGVAARGSPGSRSAARSSPRAVADNVRLSRPDAPDRDVAAALRAAGADELVAALPAGADTVIGDGGRRLSAGQSRRIALARAFLSDAPLVVLDEPTAHLDAAAAAGIEAAVARLAAGRTVLLITHRDELARARRRRRRAARRRGSRRSVSEAVA